jgi:predicted small secreted protein
VIRKIAALVAFVGTMVGATACNTIEGAGKDAKATGQAIENAAAKSKPT